MANILSDPNVLLFGSLLTGLLIPLIALIGLIIYVYSSFAFMVIAKKLKYDKPWLAWVPIGRRAMLFQLGGFNWTWALLAVVQMILVIYGLFFVMSGLSVLSLLGTIIFIGLIFLISIPLGILTIISKWRIYEKRKYQGWLSLIILGGGLPQIGVLAFIADLVILGFVAWKDR